jgi:hypothetical protein
MRPKDLKTAVKHCINSNQPLLITGAPGIGKTEIVEQAAQELTAGIEGACYMILHPVCDDPSDWKGLGFPAADRETANFLPYGNLKQLMEAPALCICIIDEIGSASESVQKAIMQPIRQRSINGKQISEHVRFILCTNRRQDKAGVAGIIEPLKSRCIIVALDVNDDDWRQWAHSAGMPSELISFSKLRPQLLHDPHPSLTEITNSSNPRGWGEVGKLQNTGIPYHLQYEMFQGCNGETFAAEYCAYLQTCKELDPQSYLDDPTKELPWKEPLLYALAAAISYKADRQNLAAVYTLAMRLDAEYSTFLIFGMIQRNKSLAQNAAFPVWAEKYANYLL